MESINQPPRSHPPPLRIPVCAIPQVLSTPFPTQRLPACSKFLSLALTASLNSISMVHRCLEVLVEMPNTLLKKDSARLHIVVNGTPSEQLSPALNSLLSLHPIANPTANCLGCLFSRLCFSLLGSL